MSVSTDKNYYSQDFIKAIEDHFKDEWDNIFHGYAFLKDFNYDGEVHSKPYGDKTCLGFERISDCNVPNLYVSSDHIYNCTLDTVSISHYGCLRYSKVKTVYGSYVTVKDSSVEYNSTNYSRMFLDAMSEDYVRFIKSTRQQKINLLTNTQPSIYDVRFRTDTFHDAKLSGYFFDELDHDLIDEFKEHGSYYGGTPSYSSFTELSNRMRNHLASHYFEILNDLYPDYDHKSLTLKDPLSSNNERPIIQIDGTILLF